MQISDDPNPIIIDDREHGIADKMRTYGIPVIEMRLEFGDCVFDGIGPGGRSVTIGIERKRLSDLLNSSRDNRLSGFQLRGMREVMGFDLCCVVSESVWTPTRGGDIHHQPHGVAKWQPHFTGKNPDPCWPLMSYLFTQILKGGIQIIRTRDSDETVAWYFALWKWFNANGGWDSHKSHDTTYAIDLSKGHKAEFDTPLNLKENAVFETAARWPGMGTVRARAASGHFRTINDMVSASVKDWMKVEGVGKGIAEAIYKHVRGI